ncbi:MAG: 3-hydroxyacyl-CoA dehydrogenase family protein [Myxococcota bacterium]|nr:3-hydroxyacyl-CoA dehydrogenase family protein [Myxococcota bacterium]
MSKSLGDLGAVVVLGAGVMGHGIGAHFARFSGRVCLYEPALDAAEAGKKRAEALLEAGRARGKLSDEACAAAAARLTVSQTLPEALEGATLVIEAAPERLSLKQSLFAEVEALTSPETLLASNTSSLSITEIAASLQYPERFIGMHFFNPVPVMKLLELVHGEKTKEETIARARQIAEQIEKVSILVKDSPGFATSRLGIALGNEAARMLQEEVASAEDIDRAMVLGYRHPIGPLALGDLVGLDTRLAISEYLYERLGHAAFDPPQILRDKVAEGALGRKSGRGFYDYSSQEQ